MKYYVRLKRIRKRKRKIIGFFFNVNKYEIYFNISFLYFMGFFYKEKVLVLAMKSIILKSIFEKNADFFINYFLKLSYYLKFNNNAYVLLNIGLSCIEEPIYIYLNYLSNLKKFYKIYFSINKKIQIYLQMYLKNQFPLFFLDFMNYDPYIYKLTSWKEFNKYLLKNNLFIFFIEVIKKINKDIIIQLVIKPTWDVFLGVENSNWLFRIK